VNRVQTLYIINLALLVTHEIDSAFWREWELFGMPGGIQLFLVVNFALTLVLLFGLRSVLLERRSALRFSLLEGAMGLFACAIHFAFLATGHRQFSLPVSMITLALIGVVSLLQAIAALKAGRGRPRFSAR
jgi:hypothetical protein